MTVPTRAAPTSTESPGSGRFAVLLALLLALGLAAQIGILREAARSNPFFDRPVLDARVYWEHGLELARGRWIADTPFLSAPLYPLVVGAVRACGGDLPALYRLQVLGYLATALLLALVGRRRAGPAAGLAAAGIYLTLIDPAYYTGRVLNCTLLGLTSAWLLERLDALERFGGTARTLTAGAALGLACLAYPPFLAAVPFAALWVLSRERARRGRRAALFTLTALATIAPATLHNYLASGELIPISAQGGITFAHGNAAGADGTYRPADGVSTDRRQQNLDALATARSELGDDAGWNDTSRYFFARGLARWADDPGQAVGLALRKAWWFLSGRIYGDIYLPRLEWQERLAPRLVFAPIPVAWWTLPALVWLLLSLCRERRRAVPDLLLFGVPFLVVCAFWYSPRYRFPALPITALLAGVALAAMTRWRERPREVALLALAFAVSLSSGTVNRALGIDRAETYQPEFDYSLGEAYLAHDDLEQARTHWRASAAAGYGRASIALAELLRHRGLHDEALRTLAALAAKDDPYYTRTLAVALAEAGQGDEARTWFERTLELDPRDAQATMGLGNVLLEQGDDRGAIARYREALRLDPFLDSARYNLALASERTGALGEAEGQLAALLERSPGHDTGRRRLYDLLKRRGELVRALDTLRAGLQADPQHGGMALLLSWDLATLPDDDLRSGEEAVRIARELAQGSPDDADVLDTLAAALAEIGAFDEAIERATRAAELARTDQRGAFAAEIDARVAGYRSGRPYRQEGPKRQE